jgi:hypothetical protein
VALTKQDKYWIMLVLWHVINTLAYLIDASAWRRQEDESKKEFWNLENI